VDWSYGLLAVPERTLFDRLAVCAGGFTVEAAEAVGAERDPADVLELLLRLVDTSLVLAEPESMRVGGGPGPLRRRRDPAGASGKRPSLARARALRATSAGAASDSAGAAAQHPITRRGGQVPGRRVRDGSWARAGAGSGPPPAGLGGVPEGGVCGSPPPREGRSSVSRRRRRRRSPTV
jgi:hypothetical protein